MLIELGSLDDIPLEGIIEVGARLKEKSTYLPRTADFSRGGAKEIADMLSDMSSNDQERYMQTLQNEDPELYAAVKVLFLTFEDIMEKFPEDQVRTLLNSIELDTLPIAFKGLDEEKINELKDMLPQKKQAMYNEDLASKHKLGTSGALLLDLNDYIYDLAVSYTHLTLPTSDLV